MGILSDLLDIKMPPFEILGQESIYKIDNVKRRRQLEKRLALSIPILGDDEEEWLADQYRLIITVFKEQNKALSKCIGLFKKHGRFNHDELKM